MLVPPSCTSLADYIPTKPKHDESGAASNFIMESRKLLNWKCRVEIYLGKNVQVRTKRHTIITSGSDWLSEILVTQGFWSRNVLLGEITFTRPCWHGHSIVGIDVILVSMSEITVTSPDCAWDYQGFDSWRFLLSPCSDVFCCWQNYCSGKVKICQKEWPTVQKCVLLAHLPQAPVHQLGGWPARSLRCGTLGGSWSCEWNFVILESPSLHNGTWLPGKHSPHGSV